MDKIIGIDIGGTKIAIGRADTRGKLEDSVRFPTDVSRGYRSILEEIIEKTSKLFERDSVKAIGIGCGGPLDSKKGRILSPPNLPGWDDVPLVDDIKGVFNVPVYLENDANAAALGEFYFGAGKDVSNMVYMTLSTGIGGGIILNNKLIHGVRDSGGEVGHQTILPDGPLCNCGNRGCLEALSSGTGIAKIFREKLASGRESIVTSWVKEPEEISAKIIADAAKAGDSLSKEVWDSAIYYLGIGISNIVTIVSPEMVVLGGSLTKYGESLFVNVREIVKERARLVPVDEIKIVPAQLGDNVGILGAVAVGLLGDER
ncbi:MAG TPA: ROK family protein [bacterium]|nr:ROK family protein [bacterium]